MRTDILFLGGTSIDLIQDKKSKDKKPRFIASVGGGITNSSVIAAKLGLKTAMLSRVGKDPLGDYAVRFLKESNVITNGIIQDSNIHTPLAIASLDRHGNSKYTFYRNAPEDSIALKHLLLQLL